MQGGVWNRCMALKASYRKQRPRRKLRQQKLRRKGSHATCSSIHLFKGNLGQTNIQHLLIQLRTTRLAKRRRLLWMTWGGCWKGTLLISSLLYIASWFFDLLLHSFSNHLLALPVAFLQMNSTVAWRFCRECWKGTPCPLQSLCQFVFYSS